MKIYRLQLKVGSSEPKIYKVKAKSSQEAEQKLRNSIVIKELSFIEEFDKTFDEMLNLFIPK